MNKLIGCFLSGLTLFVMTMGFYFIYGVLFLWIARGIVNEILFAVINLTVSIFSTVCLLLAELKWGA